MARPQSADLLKVWEESSEQPPAVRSLQLLIGLGKHAESIESMSVGEGDRQLLLLRRELFGDVVHGSCDCAACREPVEIEFRIGDVLARASAPVPPVPLESAGYSVQWRLPTCKDVAELAADCADISIHERLLESCLTEILRNQSPVALRDCPAAVIRLVGEAMSQADPFEDFRLELLCPSCGARWTAPFDVGEFLWLEIDNWARRILPDIHCLASAYGWSEQEILSMSPRRRRAYLDLLGA